MSSYFFTLFHFNSLFWLGPNEMLRLFGGLGCKLLGAGRRFLFGMNDLFFVDGGELWKNFCERVRITAPSPDLSGI